MITQKAMSDKEKSVNDNLDDKETKPASIGNSVLLDKDSFSSSTMIRLVIIALILIFIGGFIERIIYSLFHLFFLVVLAIFLAYLLTPLVNLIRSPFRNRKWDRYMPRALAITIVYVIVFSVLGFVIANVAPRLTEQAREFAASLPTYASGINQSLNDMNRRFDRLRIPEPLQARINADMAQAGEQLTTFVGGLLIASLAFLPWLVIVPILSFFFLKDVKLIRVGILAAVPPGKWRQRTATLLEDVNSTLAAYTRAMIISCFFVGTVSSIGFYFLGLKYALLLGVLAGVFELVPLLGPLTIGIIATTTAGFSGDPRKALWVALFLVIFRIFHDYVSYPRIVRGGIHLHPVLIILSVIAGEQVAGIPGVLIAIPMVAIITVLYKHILEYQGEQAMVDAIEENEASAVK